MAYPGYQRRGCLRSGPVRKVGGGLHFRSDIRKEGGGQSISGPIYKKCGGGGQFADTFVWHTENTLSLIINGYNFDRGGCSSTRSEYTTGLNKLYIHVHVPTYVLPRYTSHARANELKIVVFNCIHSLIVSFLRRRGVPEPLEPPPLNTPLHT